MRPTCGVHVVWRHFVLVPSSFFSWVPWSVSWLRHQLVTDVTAWLITPNPSCSKNRKRKEKEKRKIKIEKIKMNKVHLQRSWHPCQLGGLKFKFTTDAEDMLTHIMRSGWVKGKTTSTLAFDISQFFPSLNYNLLMTTLSKMGLEPKVSKFFVDYLVQRKTNYI